MECHHHPHCLHDALEKAEAMCAKEGLRLTDTRRRVLEILWGGHKALTAAQVMEALGNSQPPITYRALEFLEQAGLVHKVASLNAYVGCPHPEEAHQGQLLICKTCHTVEEVHLPKVETQLAAEAEAHGFAVQRATVEVVGVCRACAAA